MTAKSQQTGSKISQFAAPHTGLYKVVSDGVTQYVWIVKGDVKVEPVGPKEKK